MSAPPISSTSRLTLASDHGPPVTEGVGHTAPKEAEHEVGATRLSPVVEERHDVWVLEAGDELSLGIEAAYELVGVGELRADHLHGDLPARAGCVAA